MILPRHNQIRHPFAFTLMELLVAVAVFAIVLAAINTVLFSAMRLRNHTAAIFEEKLPVEHALATIKRDLANIVIPGGPLSGQLTSDQVTTGVNPGNTNSNGGGSLASVGNVVAQQGVTEFFVSTGIVDDNQPWGDIQKVAYLLMDPTNNTTTGTGKDLYRSVTRNLLPVASEDQSVKEWMMSGVEKLTFSYYDGSQWVDTWDSTTPNLTTGMTNMLPRAIKVQIQMATSDTLAPAKTPIELVVPVWVQVSTNTSTNSTSGG